jgi:hypothetical protein
MAAGGLDSFRTETKLPGNVAGALALADELKDLKFAVSELLTGESESRGRAGARESSN